MNWRTTVGGFLAVLILALGLAIWVAPGVAATHEAEALRRGQTASSNRQAIKQMPILQRPSRLGHFYGNTVRRRYYRQTGQG